MSIAEHVESLRTKHANLEKRLSEELHRPQPDQATVAKIKKQKLRIKEEIQSGQSR